MPALITVLEIISYLLYWVSWIVIAQVILSLLIAFNVVNTFNDFVASLWKALNTLTEPMYRPIRRVMPDTGAIDFAPVIVLILITIITRFLIPGIEASLIAPPAL